MEGFVEDHLLTFEQKRTVSGLMLMHEIAESRLSLVESPQSETRFLGMCLHSGKLFSLNWINDYKITTYNEIHLKLISVYFWNIFNMHIWNEFAVL